MEDKKEIQAALSILVDATLALIERDPHFWSTRPCPTCGAISAIIGRSFGCERKRLTQIST